MSLIPFFTASLRRRPAAQATDVAFDRAFGTALRQLSPRAVPSDNLNRLVARLAEDAQARLDRWRRVRRSVATVGGLAIVAGATAGGPRLLLSANLLQASARLHSVPMHLKVMNLDEGETPTVAEQFWMEGNDAVLLTESEAVARRNDKVYYIGSPESYPVQIGSAGDPSPDVARKEERLRPPGLRQLVDAALPFRSGAPQVIAWKRDAGRRLRSLILQLPSGERTAWSWGADDLPSDVEMLRQGGGGAWKAYRRVTLAPVSAFPVTWNTLSWRVRQTMGDGPPPPYATYYVSEGSIGIHTATGRIGTTSVSLSADGVALITYSQGARRADRQISLRLRGYHRPKFLPLSKAESAVHEPFYNGTDRVFRAQFVPLSREASQPTTLLTRDLLFEIVEPTPRGPQSHFWKVALRRQVGDLPDDLQVGRPVAAKGAESRDIGPYFTNAEPRVTMVADGTRTVPIERISMDQSGIVYVDCTDTVARNDPNWSKIALDLRIDGYQAPRNRYAQGLGMDDQSQKWMRLARRLALEPPTASTPSARDAISTQRELVLNVVLRDPATGKPVRQTVRLARVPAAASPTKQGDVGVQAK